MNSDKFDAKTYWENRLRDRYDLSGVGYLTLGKTYNRWLYKIRKYVFNKNVKPLISNVHNVHVLDIGSGTGFYIDRWKELGVSQVVGADLTDVAVRQLRNKYPDNDFYQLDIGSERIDGVGRSYTIISSFDVLFHIVDDQRFKSSIKNIYSLLQPGGYFIFSDNFLHDREVRMQHQVSRSLDDIEKTLRNSGFEVMTRRPMFIIMNAPVDTKNAAVSMGWRAMAKLISLNEVIGFIVGALLYPLERMLLSWVKESPSTEIMICRKPVV